jgi:hypothetical protein
VDAFEFEAQVVDLIQQECGRAKLQEWGIDVVVREPTRTGEGSTYGSEIAIDFFKGRSLFDVIEFMIVKDNRLVVSQPELRAWFSSALNEVIVRSRGENRSV